jgi:hypothetical protein
MMSNYGMCANSKGDCFVGKERLLAMTVCQGKKSAGAVELGL